MEKVGHDGVITVEEAKSMETNLDVVEGMQFERGYLSPYMVTDTEKMIAELENAFILLCDKKITAMKDLVPLLEAVSQQGKPLLIVCEDLEGEALAAIVLNVIRGALKVVAVKIPGFGDDSKLILEDIAVLSGAKVISEEKGMKLETTTIQDLGQAKKINVDKEKTVIVEGAGDKLKVQERVNMIKAQISATDSEYDKKDLQNRLAKLSGGVAVINVGAATETEMKEKKMRVDDALHATRAAVEEGVVAGGGVTLLRAINHLETMENGLTNDEKTGVAIVKRAIEDPVRQIAQNAGKDGAVIVERLKREQGNVGYNAKTDKYMDMFEAGVIDPAKVTRSALQNAASIAGMLLTTDALVTDNPEEKKEPSMPPMGGMPGMM